jgi:Arc/MetJ-type ribon-helix-helix transcriptional regulator
MIKYDVMKQKIAITIDENVLDGASAELELGLFRNRSHLIEYSLKKFLEGRNGSA